MLQEGLVYLAGLATLGGQAIPPAAHFQVFIGNRLQLLSQLLATCAGLVAVHWNTAEEGGLHVSEALATLGHSASISRVASDRHSGELGEERLGEPRPGGGAKTLVHARTFTESYNLTALAYAASYGWSLQMTGRTL